MSPFTVLARISVSSLLGRISVIPPFTVLNSRSLVQSARPISAYTEPFTVDASARPVVVTRTLPFTVLARTSPFNPSADISPFTVWPLNSMPAGTWTSKSTVTSLLSVLELQWSPGSQVFSRRARAGVGYTAQIVIPASDSTTLISTSSGSERRACLRALTTASAPLASTARTSPFTPFTSSRFPAAIRPCQLNSCAPAVASATQHSTATVSRVRMVILRSVRGSVGRRRRVAVRATIGTRVRARVQGSVRLRVLRRILVRVARGVRRDIVHVEMKAEARVAVVVVVIVVFIVILVFAIDPLPHLLGTAHVDVALERLELHARAPGADLERLAMLPRRVGERERKAGIDIAIRRRSSHSDVGALGYGDRDVPVVRREAVRSAILDGPLVDHVSVDRPGIDTRRLDSRHHHVAVRGFELDFTADVGQLDVFVYGVHLDTSRGVRECHGTLDRMQRDVALAAAHVDFAIHRLGADRSLHAVDRDVRIGAAQAEGHRLGDGNVEIHHRRSAFAATRLDDHRVPDQRDFDPSPAAGFGMHFDAILAPAVDGDPAPEIVDRKAGAGRHGDARIGLSLRCQRDQHRGGQRCKHVCSS